MATNNSYSIYLERVKQLARTIVIKSTDTVESMNAIVRIYYGKDRVSVDQTTWVYYMNLAGEYHFTNKEMTVVSMDTLETIVFSKENLLIHRATARAYQYGTRQYRELITRYPDQEMLVLGILYPVDKQKAIEAYDGEILNYPANLVEFNEYTFIERLQEWINGYKLRYFNRQYSVSDDLYIANNLAIMYLFLVPAILNIREEACHTVEAHSYHVREYLRSHGLLDYHLDHLSTKQTMFLYRNINYIERYAGHTDTFKWLIEHIMTERGIPLAEYDMRHDISEMPESLYPKVVFKRTPLNLGYSLDSKDVIGLHEMLMKEDVVALGNEALRPYVEDEINTLMENSINNDLATKVLESSMIDYTDSAVYTLSDTLLYHWLWFASNGYYNAVVGFTNPRTGERIPLSMKDAWILMWYAFCGSFGLELEVIPKMMAHRVVRIPTPGVEELMSMVDHTLIKPAFAEKILAMHPTIEPVISTEAFYLQCVEIHTAANAQRDEIAKLSHMDARGYAHGLISRLYSDNICSFPEDGEPYRRWFAGRNITVEDFTREDFDNLWKGIVEEATGANLTTKESVKDTQAALCGLLAQLSSYSIQILVQINQSKIISTSAPGVRIGDIGAKSFNETKDPDAAVRVIARNTRAINNVELDVSEIGFEIYNNQPARGSTSLELPKLINVTPAGSYGSIPLDIGGLRITIANPEPPNNEFVLPVPGMNSYLALPMEQRKLVGDIYRNR